MFQMPVKPYVVGIQKGYEVNLVRIKRIKGRIARGPGPAVSLLEQDQFVGRANGKILERFSKRKRRLIVDNDDFHSDITGKFLGSDRIEGSA